ncbi:helix-turn-helix domain-containing protein [Pluralibacter gergoviae]|uniref:helix-turn-helix domain-containing protein n=1 Tax=Pluralibacter gergoviae TaxID=61647 RepID=UPI0007DACC61|nr:helix-turn-helix domain-containing protein [Pluralibacter gergoviae]SUB71368.1 Helix-turn-helix [Pluralibacter gergoviae]
MGYVKKTEADAKERDRIIVEGGITRFGERLRSAMKGMSNSELSRRSGMSETSIRKYLKGDMYPGIDSAVVVAAACNVSPVWLICGLEQKGEFEADSPALTNHDPLLEVILTRLPPEQSKALVDAIILHGVTGILLALQGNSNLADFMQLTESERDRVLRLYQQIKEGDAETCDVVQTTASSGDSKKAG